MIEITKGEVRSTDGKLVHRIGTDIYGERMSLVKGDNAGCFEEVDARPAFTRGEYEAKVAELVHERYSADEESALQRKMINSMLHPEAVTLAEDGDNAVPAFVSEFDRYNAFVEQCKVKARELLSAADTAVDDGPVEEAPDTESEKQAVEDSADEDNADETE